MRQPLQIVFRNIDPSPALEHAIREHAGRLDRFYDGIMSCRVVFEIPHRHQRHGDRYSVRVDLTVPGEELVVTGSGSGGGGHESAQAAIGDAFDAARRALEDYARRRRHDVKTHSAEA